MNPFPSPPVDRLTQMQVVRTLIDHWATFPTAPGQEHALLHASASLTLALTLEPDFTPLASVEDLHPPIGPEEAPGSGEPGCSSNSSTDDPHD